MEIKETTNTKPKLAPLSYVYNKINEYLTFNNLPSWSSRIKHVQRLFDGVTTFGQIMHPIHRSQKTEYDNIIIADWFIDYLTYYVRDFILSKGNGYQDFSGILYVITNYLLSSKEAKTATISDNAEKEYRRRMTFPESMLKDEDIDDDFLLI
ncbi:hypothetical protein PACILC2_57430 [Paenibacillus cisolokensis]|uniref:Uncharacterized protein n=1 Tax=Paenibacillus cisolokensis TaxID=1658519 RepID=A0ABQ4NGH1_9BACL|nr:hypothetical protein [Paenibacillus cisolokensis]GIQ67175.1 hypothetical protein PACILC2_57430 [Paenibacillus cisolokensis]